MNKRAIVALSVFALFAVALYFHGHHLWETLLAMHGHRPR